MIANRSPSLAYTHQLQQMQSGLAQQNKPRLPQCQDNELCAEPTFDAGNGMLVPSVDASERFGRLNGNGGSNVPPMASWLAVRRLQRRLVQGLRHQLGKRDGTENPVLDRYSPPASHEGGIHTDQRKPWSSVYLDFLCNAKQPDDVDVDATTHKTDECMFNVAAKFKGYASLALCLLQFFTDSWYS